MRRHSVDWPPITFFFGQVAVEAEEGEGVGGDGRGDRRVESSIALTKLRRLVGQSPGVAQSAPLSSCWVPQTHWLIFAVCQAQPGTARQLQADPHTEPLRTTGQLFILNVRAS